MDSDTVFVMGFFITIFSVPSIVSAWSDGYAPRVAVIAGALGGAMMFWAYTQNAGGYRIGDIPDVIIRVVGRFI